MKQKHKYLIINGRFSYLLSAPDRQQLQQSVPHPSSWRQSPPSGSCRATAEWLWLSTQTAPKLNPVLRGHTLWMKDCTDLDALMLRAAVLDELWDVTDPKWPWNCVVQETFGVWKLLHEVWSITTYTKSHTWRSTSVIYTNTNNKTSSKITHNALCELVFGY